MTGPDPLEAEIDELLVGRAERRSNAPRTAHADCDSSTGPPWGGGPHRPLDPRQPSVRLRPRGVGRGAPPVRIREGAPPPCSRITFAQRGPRPPLFLWPSSFRLPMRRSGGPPASD